MEALDTGRGPGESTVSPGEGPGVCVGGVTGGDRPFFGLHNHSSFPAEVMVSNLF